jgi:small subunit ribosomal protein S4
MGFADSRQQARSSSATVTSSSTAEDRHPSFLCKQGDEIIVKPQSKGKEYFKDYGEVLSSKRAPDWISMNVTDLAGKVLSLPARDQMELPAFNEALVVEYYSR